MCAAILKFVWFADVLGQPKPVYREKPVEGDLDTALAHIKPIACDAAFRLGQLLDAGGKVLATIAHGGACKLNPVS
jgi:hypothetical protein